jgi:hypothetical protein
MIVKCLKSSGNERLWDNVIDLTYKDDSDGGVVMFHFTHISDHTLLPFVTSEELRRGTVFVYGDGNSAISMYHLGTDRGF